MPRVCGLFSGVGGFELGFSELGFETTLLCENDPSARAVLRSQFPGVRLSSDVRMLKELPPCDIVTAGWPCQDLSQAGRTAGLKGEKSGLISELFRLLDVRRRKPRLILLENVAFALSLNKGEAIHHVTSELERRGYKWAYRILDTREFGLPQRRRRVYILGSLDEDPGAILFNAPRVEISEKGIETHTGFYWTEGNRGIGWTRNAVPPLKGGSSIAIPSPPAIWKRGDGSFFSPGIGDAERLQGFPIGWTEPATSVSNDRVRWRLIGNAVSVPVVQWIARRIVAGHSRLNANNIAAELVHSGSHNAAFGGPGTQPMRLKFRVEGPARPVRGTIEKFGLDYSKPLSKRAAQGFLSRLLDSSLTRESAFVADLKNWCE